MCQGTYLFVDIWALTCDRGAVGRNAVFNKGFVDELDAFSIGLVVGDDRKIHSHCAVDLDIDEAGRNDLATEIEDLVRHPKLVIEDLLRIDDDAGLGFNPEISVYQLAIDSKTATGEFNEHL